MFFQQFTVIDLSSHIHHTILWESISLMYYKTGKKEKGKERKRENIAMFDVFERVY